MHYQVLTFTYIQLKVLSSLPRLQLYLDYQMNQQPQSRRPVTFSLAKTLRLLTRPLSKRSTFRPKELVAAMNNRRISSHDQQDAQELFQLITSALDLECHQNTKKSAVSLGLKDILHFDGEKPSRRRLFFSLFSSKNDDPRLENPFTGLLANRLSCMQCGYTVSESSEQKDGSWYSFYHRRLFVIFLSTMCNWFYLIP